MTSLDWGLWLYFVEPRPIWHIYKITNLRFIWGSGIIVKNKAERLWESEDRGVFCEIGSPKSYQCGCLNMTWARISPIAMGRQKLTRLQPRKTKTKNKLLTIYNFPFHKIMNIVKPPGCITFSLFSVDIQRDELHLNILHYNFTN